MMKNILKVMLTVAACSALPAQAAPDKPVQLAVKAPAKAAPLPQPARTPQLPAPEAMIILIRSSVVALSQANLTNNYSVLNALGSPNFRAANPPQRLSQAFEAFRVNKIDMNPVVFMTPQLTQQPVIANGRMRLVGFFPSAPMQVNYDLLFEPDQGTWKLFGLGVNLSAAK